MDEYMQTLHRALDAAAAGDLQAFHIARWLLAGLGGRLDATALLSRPGEPPRAPARPFGPPLEAGAWPVCGQHEL